MQFIPRMTINQPEKSAAGNSRYGVSTILVRRWFRRDLWKAVVYSRRDGSVVWEAPRPEYKHKRSDAIELAFGTISAFDLLDKPMG